MDGQSTEASIRQKIGADSRPVLLDEFESDQNVNRMKSVIKLIRSASSGNAIARGTPEGRVMEFSIRSTFLLAAINPFSVTSADRSRIVILTVKEHENDRSISNHITELRLKLEGMGPSWCHMVIENTHRILQAIKIIERVFPPSDSRHMQNMSALLAGAWVILNQREMNTQDAEELIANHSQIISGLAQVHEEDDAQECLNALLGYNTKDEPLGMLLGRRKAGDDTVSSILVGYGIKWEEDGFLVANSHPGISDVFRNTIWSESGWPSPLARLAGARKTKQRRFGDSVRSQAVFVPGEYIEQFPPPPGEKF